MRTVHKNDGGYSAARLKLQEILRWRAAAGPYIQPMVTHGRTAFGSITATQLRLDVRPLPPQPGSWQAKVVAAQAAHHAAGGDDPNQLYPMYGLRLSTLTQVPGAPDNKSQMCVGSETTSVFCESELS